MNKFIYLAIEQAGKNYDYQFKHGCVIVRDNELISKGYNRRQFNPILKKYGYKWAWLHAESDAIIRALRGRRNLKDASVLVIRKGKTKLCNSKPCNNCLAMMMEVGIKEVFYSNRFGDIEKICLR